ncbi:MAG TPA: ATP-binding cassette domain-containing protein [Candidatus Limnocylindria bacterium]|nr:ATP-binding cassette domain-containing protein [Candidatus Limnocylindria bacterium]
MIAPAIRVSGLRKSYGDLLVLDGIDLEIATGTVFALLGPNGAGKTTAVNILTTLLTPDAGEVEVGGCDLRSDPAGVRSAIGVTGQFSAVDDLLTGHENLRLMADLHHLGREEGRERIANLLERFELTDAAGKYVATYSGGMKRRLDLAMTLMGSPRIVFLDEPTSGVDPRGRRTMWTIVRDLVAQGITIFLTTQYLEEADELANKVAMLDHGRIVAEGTPAQLKRLVPGGTVRIEFTSADALDAAAARLTTARRDPDGPVLHVPTDGDVASLRAVLDQLDGAAADVADIGLHTPDLDDVFLSLTGQADPRKVANQ